MISSHKNYTIALLEASDSMLFFNLIDNNRARLEDFFAGTVSENKSLEATKKNCKVIEKRIAEKSYFPYIISNANDEFIGLVDVKNIDWNVPKAELGYFIDANYEGKGIITRAVNDVMKYLIKTYLFKKLLCRVDSKNTGSIHVALKNGFELEGTIKNDYRTTKGEMVDLNYYGRVFNF